MKGGFNSFTFLKTSMQKDSLQSNKHRLLPLAIGAHVLCNVECGNSYNEDRFHILNKANFAFHL